MKKKSKKLQFPSISRKIPEKVKQNKLILLSILIIFACVGLVAYDLSRNLILRKYMMEKRQALINQEKYWQKITNKYPDYRDAYFSLAVIEYRLGSFDNSLKYLSKTYELDPNFEKGWDLKRKLEMH